MHLSDLVVIVFDKHSYCRRRRHRGGVERVGKMTSHEGAGAAAAAAFVVVVAARAARGFSFSFEKEEEEIVGREEYMSSIFGNWASSSSILSAGIVLL